MDYEQEGYKNIENLKLVNYESHEPKYGYKDDFRKHLKFEKKVESISNFYSFCEKEREKYLPSFCVICSVFVEIMKRIYWGEIMIYVDMLGYMC